MYSIQYVCPQYDLEGGERLTSNALTEHPALSNDVTVAQVTIL